MATPAPELLDRLEIQTPLGPDLAERVGPSLAGYVYRSRKLPACYRVYPIDEAPLAFRNEVRTWLDRPRRYGIAPVADEGQLPDRGLYIIRYEVRGERTLAEVAADPDPAARFLLAARILRGLPEWWHAGGRGILPMPADIVVAGLGVPYWLPVPRVAPPDIRSVFADPQRGLYLAPELVRGAPPGSSSLEALDAFAVGVVLLGLFFALSPEPDPGEALLRVATGAAHHAKGLRGTLPFWLERVDEVRRALGAARELLSPDPAARTAPHLSGLVDQLEGCAGEAEPLRAVLRLREAQGPKAALDLVEDILLEREADELFVLGGDLAAALLRLPEAVEYYERAITRKPESDVFERQLKAILALVAAGPLGVLLLARTGKNRVGAKLDALLWRAFHRLPPERQAVHEESIARYLLARGEFGPAAAFVYPRLFKGTAYQWWKFGLTLAYAEAFLELGQWDDTKAQLAGVREGLIRARQNKALPEEEIKNHGIRLTELEADLQRRRAQAVAGGNTP